MLPEYAKKYKARPLEDIELSTHKYFTETYKNLVYKDTYDQQTVTFLINKILYDTTIHKCIYVFTLFLIRHSDLVT